VKNACWKLTESECVKEIARSGLKREGKEYNDRRLKFG
jgi:hypothetical protein